MKNKNKTKIYLLAATLCGMAVLCSGCDFGNKSNESEIESKIFASEMSGESQSPKMFSSLEDFVKSVSLEEYEEYSERFADVMTCNIKTDGNKIIHEFTYPEEVADEDWQFEYENLESAFNCSESLHLEFINAIKNAVDVENPAVIYSFYNTDGTLVYEGYYDENTDLEYDPRDMLPYEEGMTMEEYIQTDNFQHSLELISEEYIGEADIEVTGSENILFVDIIFKSQLSESECSELSQQKNAATQSDDNIYLDLAQSINVIRGADDSVIVLKYTNADGTVIWEKEFSTQQ